MPKKKNIIIGLMLEDIFTDYARELIESTKKAISDHTSIRLVVIAGKFINSSARDDSSLKYKLAYNAIYRLAGNDSLDGLIIHVGSVDENKRHIIEADLHSRFRGLPLVLLSSELKGFTTIGYDNRTGIIEALSSIINVAGVTDLCMLGGKDDNYDARLRKQVFIDCLKEHGIMFRDKMYEPTDMSVNTEEAAGRLLDRNTDVKAIFCVNDSSAVGLYKAMEKRKLVPGRDILVVGFDNTRMASGMKPSLTSVGADSVSLGQKMIQMILAKINGDDVRSQIISTRLYGRSSYEYTMYEYSIKDMIDINKGFIYRMFEECFYRYGDDRCDRESVDLKRLFYEIISRMLTAMNNRYLSRETAIEIRRLIDIFFNEDAMEYTDAEKLLVCVNRLQEGMAKAQRMKGVTVNVEINRLFLHMKDRAITALADKNTLDNNKFREGEEKLRSFMIKAAFPSGDDKDRTQIFSNISELGMRNAGMFLFDEPVRYVDEKETPLPDQIMLVCVMKDGEQYILPQERRKCHLSDMFRREELSSRCKNYAAFPVFFRDIIYGFIVCELNDDICTRGEYIAMILGRAMYLDEK